MATSASLASVCSLLCAAAAAGAERAAFSTCSAAGWSVVTHCLGPDHLVTLLPAESSAHLRVGPGGCAGVPRRPPVSHQGKPVGPGEWDKVIVGLEWGQECIKYATTEEIGSIRTLSFSVLGLTFPISKIYVFFRNLLTSSDSWPSPTRNCPFLTEHHFSSFWHHGKMSAKKANIHPILPIVNLST